MEYERNARLTFFLNGRPLIGIQENDLVCRIAPLFYDEIKTMECCKKASFITPSEINILLEKNVVIVSSTAIYTKKQLKYWIDLCIASWHILKQLNDTEKATRPPRKKRERKKKPLVEIKINSGE
jgi:hypothetical protein